LDRFSLARSPSIPTTSTTTATKITKEASQQGKTNAYLDLPATPIFRMWIGVTEYLFHSSAHLDAAIEAVPERPRSTAPHLATYTMVPSKVPISINFR
jgi:hypothetical protein